MFGILLTISGWKYPSRSMIERFNNQRMIVVISHTSHWDFFIFMLYRLECSEYANNLYVVMKPQPFETFDWFLRYLDCIPATKAESNGEGFVKRTIQKFENKIHYKIAISPKGKTIKSTWRSGYYYLRKGLKCDIAVGGVDYEKKCLYFGPIHRHEDIDMINKNEMDNILKHDLGEIVPLYPESSEAIITRKYDYDKISLINWALFILILIIILLLIYICWYLYKNVFSDKDEIGYCLNENLALNHI